MPEPSGLTADLALMREAAKAAGALALSYKAKGGAKAWDKAPGNPVTEADLAVNQLLFERLRTARPGYGWLSEETIDDRAERAGGRIWVVDPIDGTRAYMRENDPNWCIGIALVEARETLASIVFAPDHGELYEARRGGGAFCNDMPLKVSTPDAIENCRMIASQDMIRHPAWPKPWPSMTFAQPKPNATLYRMALVAAGRFDATLALFRKFDWDLAPGALLVSEAGGLATTHIGEPLQFNQPVPAQRSLLVAGKPLHPLLVHRVKGVELPDPNGQ